MIYVSAGSSEEIAEMLRGENEEVQRRLQAEKVANYLLGKKQVGSSGMLVTAPRQSGKTTELIKYAAEKHSKNQFIIVSGNWKIQNEIGNRFWQLFGGYIQPPSMVTPDNIHLIRGRSIPIFVDEYNLLPEYTLNDIMNSGFFVAAVTS